MKAKYATALWKQYVLDKICSRFSRPNGGKVGCKDVKKLLNRLIVALFFVAWPNAYGEFLEMNSNHMKHPPTQSTDVYEYERVEGKTVKEVVMLWGNPDRVESGEIYSAKFAGGTYTAVFTYLAKQVRVYIAADGIVLGITRIK